MITSNDTFINLCKTIESIRIKENPIQKSALTRLFLSYQYPGLENRVIKDLILVLWKIDTLGDSSTWSLFQADGMHFLRKIRLQNKKSYHLLAPVTFGSERSISNKNALKCINSLPKLSSELDAFIGVSIDGIKCVKKGVRYAD